MFGCWSVLGGEPGTPGHTWLHFSRLSPQDTQASYLRMELYRTPRPPISGWSCTGHPGLLSQDGALKDIWGLSSTDHQGLLPQIIGNKKHQSKGSSQQVSLIRNGQRVKVWNKSGFVLGQTIIFIIWWKIANVKILVIPAWSEAGVLTIRRLAALELCLPSRLSLSELIMYFLSFG